MLIRYQGALSSLIAAQIPALSTLVFNFCASFLLVFVSCLPSFQPRLNLLSCLCHFLADPTDLLTQILPATASFLRNDEQSQSIPFLTVLRPRFESQPRRHKSCHAGSRLSKRPRRSPAAAAQISAKRFRCQSCPANGRRWWWWYQHGCHEPQRHEPKRHECPPESHSAASAAATTRHDEWFDG